jgi:glycosyltransferase involved in cell wall biosynthesis
LLRSLPESEYIHIINHKVNQGYGGALKSGLRFAQTPYVLTMDSDGQHRTDDIFAMISLAKQRDADLVIGNRNWGTQAFSVRSFGKTIIRSIASILMPINIHDLNSGFKLYKTEVVKNYLPFCPNSMSFSDILTLLFLNQRCLVLELPITARQRMSGKSTINVHTAFETLINIINISVMFNPYKLFIPLAVVTLLLGLTWGIPFALQGKGVSVGSMLLLITSGLLFAIALIAGQLSAIRLQLLEQFQQSNQKNQMER